MAKLDFEIEITGDEIEAIYRRLAHSNDRDEEINNILHEYKFDVSQLEFDVISAIAYCIEALEERK